MITAKFSIKSRVEVVLRRTVFSIVIFVAITAIATKIIVSLISIWLLASDSKARLLVGNALAH